MPELTDSSPSITANANNTNMAVFAQGSFFGPDSIYAVLPGVITIKLGYTGGKLKKPTYDDPGDHTEAFCIEYNPNIIKYSELLDVFWNSHDPTVLNKRRYKSAIYFANGYELEQAEMSKNKAQEQRHQREIVTEILPLGQFFQAEDRYQKYVLRSYPNLFESLKLADDNKSLVQSHVATRLNGYLSGYGSLDQFDKEYLAWNLKAHEVELLRQIIQRNRRARCFSESSQ